MVQIGEKLDTNIVVKASGIGGLVLIVSLLIAKAFVLAAVGKHLMGVIAMGEVFRWLAMDMLVTRVPVILNNSLSN